MAQNGIFSFSKILISSKIITQKKQKYLIKYSNSASLSSNTVFQSKLDCWSLYSLLSNHFYNYIDNLSAKKMSTETLSHQYSGYLTSLRKLNLSEISRLSNDTQKSFSEKIELIKILEAQNSTQDYSLHERVKKLKLTETSVKKLLEFNEKLISEVLQSSQDFHVKRDKIKAILQENDDQINDYYQRATRYLPTSGDLNSPAVRNFSSARSQDLSDAEFVKNLHKGRLLRGVFIGMTPEEYHVFFLKESTPPLIVVDDQSVKHVQITYPDKASTKIVVNQFESTEQKEFFKKDSYMGSVNFSANFSANSLFYSVSVGASAEYTKQSNFTGATQSERKFYCMNRSNLVVKRNIVFNKRQLVFQNVFKNKIRELEEQYKKNIGNLNELKKLNQRIFKEVYEEYGTHFYIGAYYVGGRYDFSAETKYDLDSERKQVKDAISYKVQVEARAKAWGVEGGISAGISNSNTSQTNQKVKNSRFQLREETTMKGGSGASSEDFLESIKYNSDWVVLGQSKIQSSYVPIWDIVQRGIAGLHNGFYRELQSSYIRFLKYKLQTYEKWLARAVREGVDNQVLDQTIWKTNGTGFGVVVFDDFRRYIGNLLNREPHGVGALYSSQKVAHAGIWKKGVLTEGYQFRSKSWYTFTKLSPEQLANQPIGLSISLNDWVKLREKQVNLLRNQCYTLGNHISYPKTSTYTYAYSQDTVNKNFRITSKLLTHYHHFINCYGIGEQETISYTFAMQNVASKMLTIGVGPKSIFKNYRWNPQESFVYDVKSKVIYNGTSRKQTNKVIDNRVTFKIQRSQNQCNISLFANSQTSAYFSENLYNPHSNILLYMIAIVHGLNETVLIQQSL